MTVNFIINWIMDYCFNKCEILDQEGEGFGSALIEGINKVQTKYLCIFNADGSFQPNDLNKLYNLIKNNDFVYTTRYEHPGGSEDDTLLTFIGNKIFMVEPSTIPMSITCVLQMSISAAGQ
mgnify:CR=1 FL=1